MPKKKEVRLTKTCPVCQSHFTPTRNTKIYCNDGCREKNKNLLRAKAGNAKRKARLLTKEKLFDSSTFAIYLVNECKRAGTVQILAKHDSDSFIRLHEIAKSRTRYNGASTGRIRDSYEISHISAVKSSGCVGLLHPSNLRICPKSFNRARRNKSSQHGLTLPVNALSAQWRVSRRDTKAEVLSKIKKFLGKDVLNGFYEQAKLAASTRHKLVTQLIKLGHNEEEVCDLSIEDLKVLAINQGKKIREWDAPSYLEIDVALIELEKNDHVNSCIYICLKHLRLRHLNAFGRISENSIWLKLVVNGDEYQSFLLQQAWLLLHQEEYLTHFGDRHIISCYDFKSGNSENLLRRAGENITKIELIYLDRIRIGAEQIEAADSKQSAIPI